MNSRHSIVTALLAALAVALQTPGAPAADVLGNASIPPDVQDILFLGPSRPVLIRLHITIDGQPFRELWQQRFEELFADEDRDSDGRLDYEQAAAVARDMNGSLLETANHLKEIMPEGTIDRRALADYIERTAPRFMLKPRSVIGQGAALALFPLLDADGDRRLTAAELAAAEAQLVQRDFDDNGVITAGELILDPKAIAAAADPNGAESDLDPDQAPLVAIDAATTAAHLADRLLAHYDHDRDGRLATGGANIEIKLPPRLLGAWDADGDQALSRQELEKIELWSPDLELHFALGQAEVRPRRSRREPRHPEGFRVREKLLGGYHLNLGEAQIDFNRNNRDPRQADLVEMRGYDRDNNGYIDQAEATAANIGATAFKAMDVDGDGKVFKGELTSYMARQNAAAAARLHLVIRDLGQDLFGEFDLDADGLLSMRELRQARSLLDSIDANGDGVLSFDEVPARLEFELVRGVDERQEPDARMMRRVVRPTDRAETTGPLWFRKMDRNNDGDVSRGEFVGPRAAFERLDADGDGLIDRAEAEAAGKDSSGR